MVETFGTPPDRAGRERRAGLERALESDGPIVIVGRPRSGSRLLARILMANETFVGADLTPDSLDSVSWSQLFVVPLITSRFFPDWVVGADSHMLDELCEERGAHAVREFFGRATPRTWGWKFCETVFVMPLVKRLFPNARFVHLIRDGRDVCLSKRGFFQLTGAHGDPPGWHPPSLAPAIARRGHAGRPSFADFCRCVTFDDASVRSWAGLDLTDRSVLVENRFLIQMQSWMNCVQRARRYGQELGSAYVEVRYEDLCAAPVAVGSSLLRHLGLTVREETAAFLKGDAVAPRVGWWKSARLTVRETRDFANALDLGQSLLEELGYAR